ncbi:hypothetical protein BGZ99_009940 [Dissophora globulifera]|uniref:RRM domain-containing protein n=1 Tax=Dissophora globulifera TaxID=979702 RepID=A0A9P6UMJ6_9FUNG|nr:hypothetical protein BGZ99_009940 [Dissophora globulifera]
MTPQPSQSPGASPSATRPILAQGQSQGQLGLTRPQQSPAHDNTDMTASTNSKGPDGAPAPAIAFGTPSPFFMKPLTRAPDYRMNLYVKGLPPTTTTRALFEMFKPFGNVLACKVIPDFETQSCSSGFVLFDNQESCNEARWAMTQQGLYVAIAHESASIKNLPPDDPPPEIKPDVPELDNTETFPSLSAKPIKKKQQQNRKASNDKSVSSASPVRASATASIPSSSQFQVATHQASSSTTTAVTRNTVQESRDASPMPIPPSTPFPTPLPTVNQEVNTGFALGNSYLDFDSGFIGSHQNFLSEGYNHSGGFERSQTFQEKPYMGVNDIDRYMNMLEMNAIASAPKAEANINEARHPMDFNGAHVTNTVIDDFMLEDRPQRDSTLHFENLAEGLTYRDLFEQCAQYGSLVLSSVDIRYINEECFGQGRVTFQSYRESMVALAALLEKNFSVRHGESGEMYPTEPTIDDHLYDQYYQQHQDLLQFPTAQSFGTSDDMLVGSYHQFQTTPRDTLSYMTTTMNKPDVQGDFWNAPPADQQYQYDPSTRWEYNTSPLKVDMENLSNTHEKLSMLGISPQPLTLSPASSSSSSLHHTHDWPEQQQEQDYSQLSMSPTVCQSSLPADHSPKEESTTTQGLDCGPSEEGSHAADAVRPSGGFKSLSYSDIVKVPVKRPEVINDSNNGDGNNRGDDMLSPELKRRGNTNKSLDEKEYRLNLFLKNLEPMMNEYRLYEICVK